MKSDEHKQSGKMYQRCLNPQLNRHGQFEEMAKFAGFGPLDIVLLVHTDFCSTHVRLSARAPITYFINKFGLTFLCWNHKIDSRVNRQSINFVEVPRDYNCM